MTRRNVVICVGRKQGEKTVQSSPARLAAAAAPTQLACINVCRIDSSSQKVRPYSEVNSEWKALDGWEFSSLKCLVTVTACRAQTPFRWEEEEEEEGLLVVEEVEEEVLCWIRVTSIKAPLYLLGPIRGKEKDLLRENPDSIKKNPARRGQSRVLSGGGSELASPHHVSLAGRRRESLGGLTSPARPSSPACPPWYQRGCPRSRRRLTFVSGHSLFANFPFLRLGLKISGWFILLVTKSVLVLW